MFFDKIVSAEHTFAAWAEKELIKLRNAEPKIEEVAATILKYATPAVQIIVTSLAGTTAGAAAASVMGEVQKDLVALGSLIYDFGATPTAASMAASVATNLDSLLTAGHITDTTTVANVTKVVNNMTSLATALTTATTTTTA